MNIKEAETTVAKLEAKRAVCIQKGTELADERTSLAYSATPTMMRRRGT